MPRPLLSERENDERRRNAHKRVAGKLRGGGTARKYTRSGSVQVPSKLGILRSSSRRAAKTVQQEVKGSNNGASHPQHDNCVVGRVLST